MSFSFLFIRLYIPFALGYFLSFLLRVVNGAISPYLIADLSLNAEELGLLSAAYFLSFSLAQLPLGVYLDILGARKVEASLLCVAIIGCLVFAFGDDVVTLFIGRFLIGLGVSSCLMAPFKAYSLWFAKERLGFINCMQMVAGGLGASLGVAPIEILLNYTDWRGIFIILAVMLGGVALCIFMVIPDKNTPCDANNHDNAKLSCKPNPSIMEHVAIIWQIYKHPIFWQLAPLTILTQASTFSLIFLWGGVYLTQIGGLSNEISNSWVALAAVSMTIGYVVIGVGGDYVSRHYKVPLNIISFVGQVIISVSVISACFVSPQHSVFLWLVIAFFMSSGILNYSYLTQQFPISISGKINTALNLLVFLASFFMQWFIGVIIDITAGDAQNTYTLEGFTYSFAIIGVAMLLAITHFIRCNKKL